MIIRQEDRTDFENVYSVVKTAFETAEHRDGNEQDIVSALRESNAFIPELSLVAEVNGKISGHIMFTRANVGEVTVLVLAPLSVLPECQRRGIGSALVMEGHRIAKEMGYEYSFVIGSEKYYPRFGYIPAKRFGVDIPNGIPSENFMAVKLRQNARSLSGSVIYPKEFGI